MEELRVRDVMTKEVTTLRRNDVLALASDIMELGRIRHLPILEDDGVHLAGILSQRDVFRGSPARALGYSRRAQRKVLNRLLVKDVMTSDVITTAADTPLIDAASVDRAQVRLSPGSRERNARGYSHRV